MKVLVCGGRDYSNTQLIEDTLKYIQISELIEGGARGADALAKVYAVRNGIPVRTFPADWSKYGKAAGHIRNQQMLDEGKPDLVVAFPGGAGTANMVHRAFLANIKIQKVVE